MSSYDDFVHVSTGTTAWPSSTVAGDYMANSKRDRLYTSGLIIDSLRKNHPKHHLSVVPASQCDLLAFARTQDDITVTPSGDKQEIKERLFSPPVRRYNDESGGSFLDRIVFASFTYHFKETAFLLYVVEGAEDGVQYSKPTYNYLLLEESKVPEAKSAQKLVDEVIRSAASWALELHNEVLVFDQGFWQKSPELWQNIQKSRWEDVILEKERKDTIIEDVIGFFDAEEKYAEFNVPWKRGVIFYGPPGNGKTISTKALMRDISKRTSPAVEALYVKTFTSYGGPEYGIRQIFTKARQMAPCLLIFEDIDSLVNVSVRAYFLNEVDGLESNHGILMIGSTNHLERLDPGIAKRPSRFDRKYLFDVPNREERIQYCEYWRNKLKDNKKIDFPKEMSARVADITSDFSFAYLKEAFVAALLVIVAKKSGVSFAKPSGDPLSDNLLWNEIKRQVENLRKELDDQSVTGEATPGVVAAEPAFSGMPPPLTGRVEDDNRPRRRLVDRTRQEGRPKPANHQSTILPFLGNMSNAPAPRYM